MEEEMQRWNKKEWKQKGRRGRRRWRRRWPPPVASRSVYPDGDAASTTSISSRRSRWLRCSWAGRLRRAAGWRHPAARPPWPRWRSPAAPGGTAHPKRTSPGRRSPPGARTPPDGHCWPSKKSKHGVNWIHLIIITANQLLYLHIILLWISLYFHVS